MKIESYMDVQIHNLIKKAYRAFNSRDIDTALTTFRPDVKWPKTFEGGYVIGHEEIRKYWTRQWMEINPNVEPIGFNERPNGSLEVLVHQKVKGLDNNVMFDGTVKHIYTFDGGLIKTMDVEQV